MVILTWIVWRQFTGAKSYELDQNVGEKNAIMDTFVFVVGETGLVQVSITPCVGGGRRRATLYVL